MTRFANPILTIVSRPARNHTSGTKQKTALRAGVAGLGTASRTRLTALVAIEAGTVVLVRVGRALTQTGGTVLEAALVTSRTGLSAGSAAGLTRFIARFATHLILTNVVP